MAHQWFGDLVTMKWWDDIWLNEGFATWMESKPIEAWKPEWNGNLDDVSGTGGTMNQDALANTRPIHQAAETPAQIQELFDGIAYGKAASVLRMLESYLGEETFRAGVNAYLQKHQYGNATADDFWDAQAKTSKKPVDQIMPTFVKQAGVPILDVKSQCSGNSTSRNPGPAALLRGSREISGAERTTLAGSFLHEVLDRGAEVRTSQQAAGDVHAAGLLHVGSYQCRRDRILSLGLPAGDGADPGTRRRN